MKLSINILYKKILTFGVLTSILLHLFIPLLVFDYYHSTVKSPVSITSVNYFDSYEIFIESAGRRLNKNNINSPVEFKNYQANVFILINSNFSTNSVLHKYLQYTSDELIIGKFYASNFSLRSPPICLS